MWSLLFVLFIIPSIIALIIGITTRNKVITLRSIALYFLILGGVFLAQDVKSSLAFFITALIVLGNGFLFDKITGKKAFQLSIAALSLSLILILFSALYVNHALKNPNIVEIKDAVLICKNETSTSYKANSKKLLPMPSYSTCTLEYKIHYANIPTALLLNKHTLYIKPKTWGIEPLAKNCIKTSLLERKCYTQITLHQEEIKNSDNYTLTLLITPEKYNIHSQVPVVEKKIPVKIIIKQN